MSSRNFYVITSESEKTILTTTFYTSKCCFLTPKINGYTLLRINYLSKSTWGEQPVEDIPNFTCICVYFFVYLFMYLCHVWPDEKRYRLEIWHTHSHWPYLKTIFCFFRKNYFDSSTQNYMKICLRRRSADKYRSIYLNQTPFSLSYR